MRQHVYVVGEGPLDVTIGSRLCQSVGLTVARELASRGKADLDGRLAEYNRAASSLHWLVLRDLDHDADCPADLVRELLPAPNPHMRLRVAVREAEAWLLADREAASKLLAIPVHAVPERPDELDDPKRELVNLARRSGRRAVREGLVPREGSGAIVGPEYNAQLIAYVRGAWNPDEAVRWSPSLASTLRRLREWV
jgi:hypothetical protein